MFGYIDESGTPGTMHFPNDYLVASLIFFKTFAAKDMADIAIERLRRQLRVSPTYEFHFSRNALYAQQALTKLMRSLDFYIITVAIQKTKARDIATYTALAGYLATEIAQHCPDIKIEMDTNPIFWQKLKDSVKTLSPSAKIKQQRSSSQNLIQLANYVVSLASRQLKGYTTKNINYTHLASKTISFLIK